MDSNSQVFKVTITVKYNSQSWKVIFPRLRVPLPLSSGRQLQPHHYFWGVSPLGPVPGWTLHCLPQNVSALAASFIFTRTWHSQELTLFNADWREGRGAGSARFVDSYRHRYLQGDSAVLLANDKGDKWLFGSSFRFKETWTKQRVPLYSCIAFFPNFSY